MAPTMMDETENNDHFTFCQVGDPEPKGFPDLSSMNIKDENNSDTIWGDNARSDADSVKQEKVGSLTFKVVDAPSQKPSTEKSGSNVGSSKETTRGVKKPVARAKAPFQIGYTHMDWLKVTLTHPDLAGVDMLMKAVGKDCTALFNKYHAWVNAEFMLEKCLVGILEDSQK